MKNMTLKQKRKLVRITTILGLIITIILAIVVAKSGYFKTGGGFEILLKKSGIFAGIIFIIVEIMQTVYPIIPFGLTNTIGGLVFGLLVGGIYNIIAIYIGSYINFILGKKYGKNLILAFVDEKTYSKYESALNDKEKFKKILAFGFLFPIFPDDIACMIAGTSNLTKKEFMKIVIIFRPLSVILFTIVTSKTALLIFKILGM